MVTFDLNSFTCWEVNTWPVRGAGREGVEEMIYERGGGEVGESSAKTAALHLHIWTLLSGCARLNSRRVQRDV